jgi:hypothetical protein
VLDALKLMRVYVYRSEILEELARHGLRPLADTSPRQLRDAVRDLYKYEIRRLKSRLLSGEFRKQDYAGKVIELRQRYVILSIPTDLWARNTGE